MKKIFLPLLFVIIIFSSCTKGGGSTPGGGNNGGGGNGGGNGGGGNSGTITITSVTPANPYPDDPITINGTGFDPDITKDTVEFGRLVNGVFGAWHDGLPTEWPSLATVKSASATQLVVQSPVPQTLDFYSFPTFSTTSIAVMQVRSGGKKAVTPVIPWKRYLLLGFIANPDQFNAALGRPNDSLVIGGKGFSTTGLSISIDGTSLTNFKADNDSYSAHATLRLPKLIFGENNDDTATQLKTVTVTNLDGKSMHKDFRFYLSPRMTISSMQAEKNTYSKSGGGSVRIDVIGRCFKSDATVKIGAIGYLAEGNLGASGFPDSKILEIGISSSMPAGSYTVGIWRGNTWYGSCTFNLTN